MNFALILFILTVITGIFWIFERTVFLPQRRRKAEEAASAFEAANREALGRGDAAVGEDLRRLKATALRQPWWLEYTAGLFPVILIVFLLRSFLFEPFRIPSGSMLPTLHIGDFILVNKYDYGIRLPVLNTKVLEVGAPQKGDIIVFRYPMDESVDFIKRVVATPGDRVEYRDKVLYVNGVEQAQSRPRDFVDDSTMVTLEERTENLSGLEHSIAVDHRRPSWVPMQAVMKKESTCSYNGRGFVCTGPEGKYFAMGDNRDNSEDSRFWGFVPDENLVGKAVCIWANFSDMGRIGSIY
mgnify:FL=1